MLTYLIRRLLLFIPVVFTVGVLVFILFRLIPGDPAVIMLGEGATFEQLEALRERLGLNQPIYLQLYNWFANMFRGDLGDSLFYREPALNVIFRRISPTLSLILVATVISIIVAVPTGIIAAIKRGSMFDSALMGFTFLGVSVPHFWSGLMMIIIIAVQLRWLPTGGYLPIEAGLWPWLSHLLMPATALGLTQAGVLARMARYTMIDVLDQDFIRTAKAKGLSRYVVIMKHAFPNTANIILTVVGNGVGVLLAGAVVIETIFNLRGLGWLTINAISTRDYPLAQATVLFVALSFSLINLIVDMLYGVIDPRIRYD